MLKSAGDILEDKGYQLVKSSSIYETEAWGMKDAPAFLNQILVLEAINSPEEALRDCLATELYLGRSRKGTDVGYMNRTIDIDILYYDSIVIKTGTLEIPHPRIQDRRFTLEPLVEVLPMYIHPILKKSNASLLKICTDSLESRQIK